MAKVAASANPSGSPEAIVVSSVTVADGNAAFAVATRVSFTTSFGT